MGLGTEGVGGGGGAAVNGPGRGRPQLRRVSVRAHRAAAVHHGRAAGLACPSPAGEGGGKLGVRSPAAGEAGGLGGWLPAGGALREGRGGRVQGGLERGPALRAAAARPHGPSPRRSSRPVSPRPGGAGESSCGVLLAGGWEGAANKTASLTTVCVKMNTRCVYACVLVVSDRTAWLI